MLLHPPPAPPTLAGRGKGVADLESELDALKIEYDKANGKKARDRIRLKIKSKELQLAAAKAVKSAHSSAAGAGGGGTGLGSPELVLRVGAPSSAPATARCASHAALLSAPPVPRRNQRRCGGS